uniref:Macaca fascicularis brain cDNA clone: QtrA-17986, similar to human zinc finger protein 336 (ZNF336), mRNA, RefSeq: NM_022482.3 n=1 Tax=Macaca fascicularis TaxID=9541 RepID=I7G9T1_MACFA|nr:unnamed protein product [Macaca fascicularis]
MWARTASADFPELLLTCTALSQRFKSFPSKILICMISATLLTNKAVNITSLNSGVGCMLIVLILDYLV